MIVLDASAAVDVLLNFEPNAARVRERIGQEDSGDVRGSLHVPHLFEVEVLHVLRRLTLGGQIPERRGLRAVRLLQNMRLTRYSHAPFVERVWELRKNVTAYDAAYVALSEALEAPIVTTDGRLAKAPGHRAKIEVYGDP